MEEKVSFAELFAFSAEGGFGDVSAAVLGVSCF